MRKQRKILSSVTIGGTTGYRLSDIKKAFTPDQFSKLEHWLNGQTMMAIDKDDVLVYEVDFERFLKRLPPLD